MSTIQREMEREKQHTTSPSYGTQSRQQPGSACDECRKRKLRCDRKQPQCGTCADSAVNCVMRTVCPPRGPKKGHLRHIRNQIAALESRLNQQDQKGTTCRSSDDDEGSDGTPGAQSSSVNQNTAAPVAGITDFWPSMPMPMQISNQPPVPLSGVDSGSPDLTLTNMAISPDILDTTPIEMHLTELVCSDLDLSYFNRVHPFAPILHKSRYYKWSRQPAKRRQHLCLQYAMWTMAASLTSQFQFIRSRLYAETRQMLNVLDMEHGEEGGTSLLDRCQAWILLSIYEFTMVDYRRGLVSAGRAFRMVQLLGLSEVDSPAAVAEQLADWTELESMRRTFWLAYTMDRLTGVNNGPVLTFNEQEIRTRLPAPEENFTSSRPIAMPLLSEVMSRTGADLYRSSEGFPMSDFVESILVANISGRILGHKRRSLVEQSQTYGESTQDFLRRHQCLDNILSSRIEGLAARIGARHADGSAPELSDPMLIFTLLVAQLNVLLLYDIMESTLPFGIKESQSLVLDYNQRSLEATQEMASLATMLAQLNHFQTHFFTPIPLLFTARFCAAHSPLDEAYGTRLQAIDKALGKLANANQMAKDYFQVVDGDSIIALVIA